MLKMHFDLIMLSFTKQQLECYIKAIKQSNIDRIMQSELVDLLNTAIIQVGQAKKMGWLP